MRRGSFRNLQGTHFNRNATFWKVASIVTVPMGLEIALLNPKLDVCANVAKSAPLLEKRYSIEML